MVSIIIVNYKVQEEIFTLLSSLTSEKIGMKYEIIIVDNESSSSFKKNLHKKFPLAIYISPKTNLGYGSANNLAASRARGEYLFFLNPDTVMQTGKISFLIDFLQKLKKTAFIAPLLLDTKKKAYLQGTRLLTPVRALFALSFINKIFPRNPISKHYWQLDQNHKKVREVDVVPGTAFCIRADVFHKVGGFDPKFFLYFEEFDFCKRAKALGYRGYILPSVSFVHSWGCSTKTRSDTEQIFSQSRFYYFRKHFGLLSAVLVHVITSIGKADVFAIALCVFGFFLTTFQLFNRAPFIGDQGWFFLSARDMLLSGDIPLIGIASSHPWLHQGALWTYLLGVAFWLGDFHPLSGFYLSAAIGLLTSLSFYFVIKKMFGASISVIGTLFFATSPEIIYSNQMAYHTVPIAICIIWYMYALFYLAKGKVIYIPVAVISLALLYQVELFSVIFIPLLFLVLGYDAYRKTIGMSEIQNKKLWILTFVAFGISFAPILIYDFQHGFTQTFGFVAWIGYSVLKALHVFPATGTPASVSELITFFLDTLRKIIFYPSSIISFGLFFASSVVLFAQIKKFFKENTVSYALLLLWCILPMLGILITRTASHAYVPVLYPALCALCGIGLVSIVRSRILLVTLLAVSICVNTYSVLVTLPVDTKAQLFSLEKRVEVAQRIVDLSGGQPMRLRGAGEGSQFRSFMMNYEYLIWWLGGSVKKLSPLEFTILETPDGIFISQSSMEARMLQ